MAPVGRAGTLQEVEPEALSRELAGGGAPFLVDVREPWEFEIAHVAGSRLLPLGSLPEQLAELPRDRPLVTVCHHGVRSATAASLLRRAGYQDVRSLSTPRCGGTESDTLEAGVRREGECRRGDSNPHGLAPTAP